MGREEVTARVFRNLCHLQVGFRTADQRRDTLAQEVHCFRRDGQIIKLLSSAATVLVINHLLVRVFL